MFNVANLVVSRQAAIALGFVKAGAAVRCLDRLLSRISDQELPFRIVQQIRTQVC